MSGEPGRTIRFADLNVRVVSGVALGLVALALVWLGAPWSTALVILLLVPMLWEWHAMVTRDRRAARPAVAILALGGAAAAALAVPAGFGAAVVCLMAAGLAAGLLARDGFSWLVGGTLYMGGAMCALVLFRAPPDGFLIILWLVLVVIASDVGAYFAGRSLGGPKLWRRVSPGKTWSGAAGGLVAAGIVGLLVALAAGWDLGRTLLPSLGMGVASQLGDLLESAAKRRCGVKDASRLMPGHGGVMDRLDGMMGASWFFLLYAGPGGVLGI